MRPKLFSISLSGHMSTGCRKMASKSASQVNANGEMIHGTRASEPEYRNLNVGTRVNVGLRYQSVETKASKLE